MKGSIAFRVGQWLGRFRWLHPVLRQYSHTSVLDRRRYYVNRISGTVMPHTDHQNGGL